MDKDTMCICQGEEQITFESSISPQIMCLVQQITSSLWSSFSINLLILPRHQPVETPSFGRCVFYHNANLMWRLTKTVWASALVITIVIKNQKLKMTNKIKCWRYVYMYSRFMLFFQVNRHMHTHTHTNSIKNELTLNGLPSLLLKNMEAMGASVGKRLSLKIGKVHSEFRKRRRKKQCLWKLLVWQLHEWCKEHW